MQIFTNGPRGKGMKRSTKGSGSQRSRSHETGDRFGAQVAVHGIENLYVGL